MLGQFLKELAVCAALVLVVFTMAGLRHKLHEEAADEGEEKAEG
jgi:hypothetical protein